jgi:hypothetical protein
MKRTLAMILALVMVFTVLPLVVFADSSAGEVTITVDGTVYTAHQGDIINYVYYLNTGEVLCSLEGELYFSPTGLEPVPVETEDASVGSQMFPRIGSAVVSNIYQPGTMAFNYSHKDGVNFNKNTSKLIDTQFRVIAASGSYKLKTTLNVVCGADEKKYIYKGVTVNPLLRQESEVTIETPPAPTEPSTEPPTEPETEPPTAPTEAPTAVPTEAPSQAPTEPLNGIGSDGYYRENGVIAADKGLVEIDGYFYYVIYNGKIKKDGVRTVTKEKSNGLVPPGDYHFGPDGRMTDPPAPVQEPENGIDSEGYYRENGQIVPDKGLIEIDGYYYFVIYNGKIKTNGDRTVTQEKSNGLLPAGTYHFGPDGKMTNPPAPGPYIDADGYYREDGVIMAGKGLIKLDGYYYYVIYDGRIKKDGDRTVTAEMNNTRLPNGTYHFGPDGRMTDVPIIPPYIDEEGYYRENDEIVPDKGLVLIDGDYYYVVYNGKIKKGDDRTVTAEKANGLLPAGTYHFGPDGKMTNVPVLEGIGTDGYYRENGQIMLDKGLIEIDGYYYYVIYNGKIKTNGDRTVTAEKANGLLPAGTYHFGADGKMTNPPAPVQEPEDGIDSQGYYRENGQIVEDKGLVQIDGNYYFVVYNGKIKKNGWRTVTAEKANGLLAPGDYYFGADGKLDFNA